MSKDVERKLWARVVWQMSDIRADDGGFIWDTVLQKSQFFAYRREIIDYFRKELQVTTADFSEEKINEIISLPHVYWRDLEWMGINPKSIFYPDIDESSADWDYSRWIQWDRFSTTISWENKTWNQVKEWVQKKANNAQWVGIHATRSTRGTQWYTDIDQHYRWGSADTTAWGWEN
jgi:hypothetical protein